MQGQESKTSAANKQGLYAQISERTGVAAGDVQKILEAMGVQKHLDEATRLLGTTPNVGNLVVGFRVSASTVTV